MAVRARGRQRGAQRANLGAEGRGQGGGRDGGGGGGAAGGGERSGGWASACGEGFLELGVEGTVSLFRERRAGLDGWEVELFAEAEGVLVGLREGGRRVGEGGGGGSTGRRRCGRRRIDGRPPPGA